MKTLRNSVNETVVVDLEVIEPKTKKVARLETLTTFNHKDK